MTQLDIKYLLMCLQEHPTPHYVHIHRTREKISPNYWASIWKCGVTHYFKLHC